MSAQLAGDAGTSNSFHARLSLAAGVSVAINAPTLVALSSVVALLQPTTEAANEGKRTPAPQPAATAPAGSPASATVEPSAQAAAAPAAAAASTASSSAPAESPAVTFDDVKKAFLGLSSSKGRAAAEKLLAMFGLGKLSEAKPEQHADILAEIKKLAA